MCSSDLDELHIGLHQLMNHLEAVGADGAFGFRNLHDGIGQTRYCLGLGCTPGKADIHLSQPMKAEFIMYVLMQNFIMIFLWHIAGIFIFKLIEKITWPR